MSDILPLALEYVRVGPVIPLWPKTKKPKVKTPAGVPLDGFWNLAAYTEEQVLQWRALWRNAYVGRPTGRGAFILDLDFKHGAVVNPAWPADTLRVRTPSGGEHWWYSYPASEFIPSSADGEGGRMGDFIDVRADKGLVALAGSPGYTWINDLPIRPLPAWMAEAARTSPHRRDRASRGSVRGFEFLDVVREGGRNGYLASAAGAFLRRGVESDELEGVLQEHNRRVCRPMLDEVEVSSIAASIGRYDVSNVSIHPKGVGYLDSSQRRSHPRRVRGH